jgi:ferrous iron transport protein B
MKKKLNVALLGNPNSGKSSIFNLLTGLRQHVSNFPGVTVEKKVGTIIVDQDKTIEITDFPGTYSLFPNSSDEKIVVNILTNPTHENYPDLVLYVADVNYLERHLLLATQISDLGIPMVILINMVDQLNNIEDLNLDGLKKHLGQNILPFSAKTSYNIEELKSCLTEAFESTDALKPTNSFYSLNNTEIKISQLLNSTIQKGNNYSHKIIAHHYLWVDHISQDHKSYISKINAENNFEDIRFQIEETMQRYDKISPITQHAVKNLSLGEKNLTEKIDDIITHKILGPIIFFAIMFFTFQAIFSWSEYPMEWIESLFSMAGTFASSILPSGWISDLIVDGIIAGLGGIAVFIPQITILFLLIALLEESGYMSRAVFMFDNIMQKFGLNGRSIVALVSSGACAIPAIMSTRTISNWKERIITIMVSPLISCSARIPVYTVLIGFVIPAGSIYGFNQQGLAFMGLYLLGIVAALLMAFIMKLIIKSEGSSFLMIELPHYKKPIWKNVLLTVKEKVMTFIVEAGKVILIISIILWFMASYGPGNQLETAAENAKTEAKIRNYSIEETNNYIASQKIEASYAGHVGKFIEPAIKPLGFDWKIGIALITSFAAREVFVGTMATIYSIGSDDSESSVRDKMSNELRSGTNDKMYNRATAMSLLIFYVFAMQCMSTVAVVKRETNGWKWPIIQFMIMGLLAYIGSFIVYNLLR